MIDLKNRQYTKNMLNKCPGSEKPVWKYRQSRKQQQRYVR